MDKTVKQIKQTDLTGECWMIQFEGLRACEIVRLRALKNVEAKI